ncbi:energy transducer TonB [Sporomusa malonica]|uniref:Outer membrane transport energization protein TonB n=1 Tax=Sporomusa malonica TaxID=112901 RepID=A0A1W2DQW6_9FIRM|nr:energy transducer TonB [Sporomusa malonica]SMC99890.1 outer membrane transport energization protein TonB [Sporomusa malonica]
MKYLSKSPYTKTTGISLLLHGALIVCLTMLGPPYHPGNKPAEITAIEVDIVPVAVVETADTAHSTPSESPPPAPTKQPVPKLVPIATRTELLPPSIPGETNDIYVTKTVSAGTAVVGQTTAAGHSGEQATTGNGEANSHDSGARTSPSYLSGSKPAYPQAARKAGWEGSVVVRLLIDTDGSVESVSVKVGSGYGILDEAAVQTVKKWRFSPAKKGSVPITSFHDVRVRFRLDEAE